MLTKLLLCISIYVGTSATSSDGGGCGDILCTDIWQPVCGSDGRTYSNECDMRAITCGKPVKVTKLWDGKCSTPAPSVDVDKRQKTFCPDICMALWAPVCGSDGKTYSNDCSLESASCHATSGVKITKVSDGACGGGADPKLQQPLEVSKRQDSCGDIVCTNDWQPVCGSDGTTYSNECNMRAITCGKPVKVYKLWDGKCPSLEVSKRQKSFCPDICMALWAPVCGSDGKTYSNDCSLESASCHATSGVKITKVSDGACGGSGGPKLQQPLEVSKRDDCPKGCPRIWAPVCGSDGKTYGNSCDLKMQACIKKVNITKVADGACGAAGKEDLEVSKRQDGGETCPLICPMIYSPICGSDGKTHGNACELKSRACHSGVNITIVHDGPCDKRPQKHCPSICTADWSPVCGSDGKTYSNMCALGVAACQQDDAGITKVSDGPCKRAPFVRRRRATNIQKRQRCPFFCPANVSPVCGSDGHTYSNDCELGIKNCETNGRVSKQHDGACAAKPVKADCTQMVCSAIYSPVCGSDGKTYSSECQVRIAQCQSDKPLSVVYVGECQDSKQSVSKRGADSDCPAYCLKIYFPVCGSDGKTYGNNCMMTKEACERNVTITAVRQGVCSQDTAAVSAKRRVADCPSVCPMFYLPQCGSDGRTYGNGCSLKIFNCQNPKANVSIVHMGACGSDGSDVKLLKREAQRAADCPTICPMIYLPQCGSDGRTYGNDCDLKIRNCQNPKANVTIVHMGACRSDGNDVKMLKPLQPEVVEEASSRKRKAVKTAACPTSCPKMLDPVCASDGRTYQSQCFMLMAACQSGRTEVTVYHTGRCGASEVPSGTTKPGVCPSACPEMYQPVCGSDGKTYDNKCFLGMEACKLHVNISVVSAGVCSGGRPTLCPTCKG